MRIDTPIRQAVEHVGAVVAAHGRGLGLHNVDDARFLATFDAATETIAGSLRDAHRSIDAALGAVAVNSRGHGVSPSLERASSALADARSSVATLRLSAELAADADLDLFARLDRYHEVRAELRFVDDQLAGAWAAITPDVDYPRSLVSGPLLDGFGTRPQQLRDVLEQLGASGDPRSSARLAAAARSELWRMGESLMRSMDRREVGEHGRSVAVDMLERLQRSGRDLAAASVAHLDGEVTAAGAVRSAAARAVATLDAFERTRL